MPSDRQIQWMYSSCCSEGNGSFLSTGHGSLESGKRYSGLVSTSSSIFHGRPFSSGSVRLEMSTGTDWPRLEDPLVEVVLHFSELDPSHVQGALEDLELLVVFACHSLKSWTRPDHSAISWIPNASTIQVSKSFMYAIHSQSCSGQITICLCRSAGLA